MLRMSFQGFIKSLLIQIILKSRCVFIDGFNGFVANEYRILELIITNAKYVTVTLATDSFGCRDKYNLFLM